MGRAGSKGRKKRSSLPRLKHLDTNPRGAPRFDQVLPAMKRYDREGLRRTGRAPITTSMGNVFRWESFVVGAITAIVVAAAVVAAIVHW